MLQQHDLKTPKGRVHLRSEGDHLEFCFHGQWNAGDMHLVWEAIANTRSNLHLNLYECTYLDSGAVGILMGALRQASIDGRALRFCYPGPTMHRILQLNGLDRFVVRDPSACALGRPCDTTA